VSEPIVRVRDAFPNETGPQPEPSLTGLSAVEFLRASGWEQSEYPGPHRVSEARVWTHPRHTPNGPVTLRLALHLAGYGRG
jgi:hypothetical protein